MIESSIVPGDPDQASALSVMREMASIVRELGLPPNGGRVVGGTDKLPEALAKELGERVLYEAEVKRIEQKADRVRILFVRKGRFHAADADRVVVAIPYSVLRDVEITPALSPKKQKAIREMKLVSVSRVWLQSSNRYWNLRGESGDADSDLLVGDVKDETAMLPGPKGVLSAYLSNAKAREMCARIPPERVMAALSDFEKIHPGMGDHLSVGLVKCWDEEPFAKGAYPWFAVGQMTEFGTALYAPEGRLHFAGDHTSNRPGFMHGAVESAKRAVAEVLAALRPKPTSVTDERQRA
jgi:monoamine oxidase